MGAWACFSLYGVLILLAPFSDYDNIRVGYSFQVFKVRELAFDLSPL